MKLYLKGKFSVANLGETTVELNTKLYELHKKGYLISTTIEELEIVDSNGDILRVPSNALYLLTEPFRKGSTRVFTLEQLEHIFVGNRYKHYTYNKEEHKRITQRYPQNLFVNKMYERGIKKQIKEELIKVLSDSIIKSDSFSLNLHTQKVIHTMTKNLHMIGGVKHLNDDAEVIARKGYSNYRINIGLYGWNRTYYGTASIILPLRSEYTLDYIGVGRMNKLSEE